VTPHFAAALFRAQRIVRETMQQDLFDAADTAY
jgi:hypothetical protein